MNFYQLGGTADVEHAEQLVTALKALGWPAKVVTGDIEAIWNLDSFTDLHDFEIDFERIKDRFWPPYQWREVFPCEECGCTCRSEIEGSTTIKSFIDYNPSP